MNREMKDAWRKAWLDGVPQIKRRRFDASGGFCAQGILLDREGFSLEPLRKSILGCPVCGATTGTVGVDPGAPLGHELHVIAHLNNDHEFDFAKIAEVMPDDEESDK